MKYALIPAAMLLSCTAAIAEGASGADKADPFKQPSVAYLEKFGVRDQKIFVYERYNAKGELVSRDVTPLIQPVQVDSSTLRTINGVKYRLRGLNACPSRTIKYQAEEWDCSKAAKDYQEAVYNNRSSVILCKTLVLQSKAAEPDAVSCFSLVGRGSDLEPFRVAYDDDAMVFMNMASIGRGKDGHSLRPDLGRSAKLGEQFQQ
ncbi:MULTISPECIES: hypothetical protein [Brucella]|uniref:Lipoprotein n=1 Tax=Brucella tritici TaxID=94626 RepID=A0A6L3YD61_9HYPH|nr:MULTISPECIES: hypothetical protein [Brucella]KAB2681175.1 hypothetical protein F9L08_19955 [Brucella tritici]KAB2757343.1 hypothetical protein F9K98_23380 [Brucella anthropi]KAB2775272.1 hypothetical protein F9K99_22755 [Brucella anthropi]